MEEAGILGNAALLNVVLPSFDPGQFFDEIPANVHLCTRLGPLPVVSCQ
jgi:hypothetical protein